MKIFSDKWQVEGGLRDRLLPGRARRSARAANVVGCSIIHDSTAASRHPSPVTRHPERGIALIITLIMLAITLVMAVAFLALAKRERSSVSTNTDTIVAQEAAKSALAAAQSQIAANMFSGFNGIGSSNANNVHVFVSTNYINPAGFNKNVAYVNPTNVNYVDQNGISLAGNNLIQNVANLWFLPRAPVFVPTNPLTAPLAYDFRYYLDLNENGAFDPNGMQPVISDNPALPYYDINTNLVSSPVNILSNFYVGDPEWIGVLEHPDAPHGPNNHFTSRYAFIAVPAGNALDINYLYNDAYNVWHNQYATINPAFDGFIRNQGVGSWEINLAAFLADLNTNQWDSEISGGVYNYRTPSGLNNNGEAFYDASSLLSYRYYNTYFTLTNAYGSLTNLLNYPFNIDAFSDGPLQTTLDTTPGSFSVNLNLPWSGANNTNHYFTLGDFFDTSKQVTAAFINDLRSAGTKTTSTGLRPTYDRYTYYRMLDQLASDSAPDDGRLNLNYSNAVVKYTLLNGVTVPVGVAVVPGAETNLVRWRPLDFFTAAADQMVRTYSSNWWSANYVAFSNNFGMTVPFSITNIPVWVSNRFVYTPAVHRLLQLAANIYDATTNVNYNLPHVFRPLFVRQNNFNGDVYIVGYTNVASVTGTSDPQLDNPYDITQLSAFPPNQPILDNRGSPINVYGVPWIVGAKPWLPNFNQFYMVTAAQITRKLEVTRTTENPRTAIYGTNQMYVIGISNSMGVNFWNSYSNVYNPRTPGGKLTIYASDAVIMNLTNAYNGFGAYNPNGYYTWTVNTNFTTTATMTSWPGSVWSGTPPNTSPQSTSFFPVYWSYLFQSPLTYNFNTRQFDLNGQWQATTPPLPQLDQFGLVITNYLQAYILDGNNVIDYVQLRAPISTGGLNQALADPNYSQPGNIYYQWSTNAYQNLPPPGNTPYGVINQVWVSGHYASAPPGGVWSTAPTPMGVSSPDAESAYFNGFFTPTFQYNGQTYVNHETTIQAPYTPSRTVYTSYLLQANDPLVHYTSSDLNSQVNSLAIWNAKLAYRNGIWAHSDDLINTPLPVPPLSPVGGRYQPWGKVGQMAALGIGVADGNPYNLSYKDPLIWQPDNWDFPTNLYPSVGWLGRVHRGTPWQTVYLKSTNVLSMSPAGVSTWANWTGNIQTNFYSYYFDTQNTAPQQDYVLFDIFTARLNDNAARGTLPVNVGMGRPDGGLAAWSALFSGMVAITNNSTFPFAGTPLAYTSSLINPAGPNLAESAVWRIVNGPFGINVTRANTNLFPYQAFTHVGQILATPALSLQSPFINTNYVLSGRNTWYQVTNAINDEMYEWLPQHMMGLVRGTEARYVLYCYGQTLRPAPGGIVLSGGNYFQLVTNYQVTAESVIRAVVRVENANSATPHVVVESYNVLPPN